jgi:hypothetical protein
MSFMFEIYYKAPVDRSREATLTTQASRFGGKLDYQEEEGTVCLTYEFEDLAKAEAAAALLRRSGEHVEGPQDYGE